mgnify:FL=1
MVKTLTEVEVINSDILTGVSEETYNGVACIKLTFEQNEPRYMDCRRKESKEKYLTAQSLVGEIVKVFAWDPDNEPGKWSSRNWFADLFPITIKKKSCKVCGISDNLLTYSEDFGKSWMHYSCKFSK